MMHAIYSLKYIYNAKFTLLTHTSILKLTKGITTGAKRLFFPLKCLQVFLFDILF